MPRMTAAMKKNIASVGDIRPAEYGPATNGLSSKLVIASICVRSLPTARFLAGITLGAPVSPFAPCVYAQSAAHEILTISS